MKVFSFVWCASGCVSFCVLLFIHWLERRWSDGRYILHIQLNHCFSGPTTSYRWINIGKYKKQNVDDNNNKRNKRLINRQTTIKKKSKYTKSNNNHRRRCVNCTAIKLHKDILPYVKRLKFILIDSEHTISLQLTTTRMLLTAPPTHQRQRQTKRKNNYTF